jgi:integrase
MARIRKVEKIMWASGKATYRAPYIDAAGQRRSKNFRTVAAAKAFLLTVGHELAQGVHTPASMSPTIAEASQLWIAHCERQGLEPTTVTNYMQHVDLHITPFIGSVKLSELTTTAVNAFIDRLHDAGRSADMIRRVVVSLGSIFKEARRRGLVSTSPTSGVNRKKADRENPRSVIPSKKELQAILAAAKAHGPRWHALVSVAIFGGLRASELRGLRWEDVDFSGKMLHVSQRADARNTIGKLKSKSGYRSIPLSPEVVKALREWKLKCPNGAPRLVFPNRLGNVDSYLGIIEQGYLPIQIAAKVTIKCADGLRAKYGLHALRHACASLWIEEGLNAKRIQKLMGHSSIQVTFDIYGHMFADADADQRAAASVHARLLGG